MKPNFSQVAQSVPFDNSENQFNASSVQNILDDLSFFNRDYLPVRTREYFIPSGFQFRCFNKLTLDGTLTTDGSGVIF